MCTEIYELKTFENKSLAQFLQKPKVHRYTLHTRKFNRYLKMLNKILRQLSSFIFSFCASLQLVFGLKNYVNEV